MISIDDVLKDLTEIEKQAKNEISKTFIQGLKVMAKLFSTMRSNQLLTEDEKNELKKHRESNRKNK